MVSAAFAEARAALPVRPAQTGSGCPLGGALPLSQRRAGSASGSVAAPAAGQQLKTEGDTSSAAAPAPRPTGAPRLGPRCGPWHGAGQACARSAAARCCCCTAPATGLTRSARSAACLAGYCVPPLLRQLRHITSRYTPCQGARNSTAYNAGLCAIASQGRQHLPGTSYGSFRQLLGIPAATCSATPRPTLRALARRWAQSPPPPTGGPGTPPGTGRRQHTTGPACRQGQGKRTASPPPCRRATSPTLTAGRPGGGVQLCRVSRRAATLPQIQKSPCR